MTSLGQPPSVVGTVRPEGLAPLAAIPPHDRPCDIVEARFDLATAVDTADPAGEWATFFPGAERLEQLGWPVLATIRLVADGGRATGDAQRLPSFDALLRFVSWVDIEVESAIAAPVAQLAHERGRRVVVSHHDFAGTPNPEMIVPIIDRAAALGADIVKIATLVQDLADHDRLIDLLRERRGQQMGPALAVVGMGAQGTSLRSYLPCVGSRLTYGYLETSAAPGQIHARLLRQRLLMDCPGYARSFAQEQP